MSKKHSKTNRQSDASGQRPAYRMRELIVRHGDDWAEHRTVTDDRPRPNDVVEAEIDGLRTANATLAEALQAVDPKAWDRFMRSDGHGVITAEPVNAEAPAPADDMIAVVVELENERDEARRMLERAKQRIRQQDRDLARQTGMLREAHERAQADVTRWRDAEERCVRHDELSTVAVRSAEAKVAELEDKLQLVMTQRDRINEHAHQLQTRLDAEPQPFLKANQELRAELEQTVAERDQAKRNCAKLGEAERRITELEAEVDRLQVYERTVDGLGKGEHGELVTRIQSLEGQLAQANKTIADLAPF